MRVNHLALAVAASTLGLSVSQQASADFLKDSKLTLGLRNFYFQNDNHEGGSDEKDWAQAFRVDYLSGFTEGTLGFGLDVTGNLAVKLDGGRGNHPDGSSVLPSDTDHSGQDNWSTVGATAKFALAKTELRMGNSLQPRLPVILTNDGRLLTQMYEGGMVTSKDIDGLTLTAGQIEHTITRASSNWTPLSVNGGTEGSNQFRFAGGDWQVNKALKLQYYYANLEDYYKQQFAGLVHVLSFGGNQSFKTDLRYFKSDSDGKNGDPGYQFNNNNGYAKHAGEVDNDTWIAMFTYSLGSHSLMAGYQHVSDDGALVWLNQGSVTKNGGSTAAGDRAEGEGGADFYSFTNAMVGNFARAGEKSSFAQYSYDFTSLGVPGLKTAIYYIHGSDIKDNPNSANDGVGGDHAEWERSERVDYTVQSGAAKGLTLTLRHARYKGEGSSFADQDQYRFIVAYPLSIL
ncbi:OprD family outer membrane porin [Pseudomonas typographi]|uniref:OprD family porin n=1 Tax=Pseudomonas typographi TaxID=2715964 RepID=A0ABR7Z4U0_9PSED|nr:OprD family outer membrane porin [Pseudomonas typographi]MBD1553041.1 OprD family porin [Pseudomonas typographi]MBD1588432.1 OprD family porin [Pseudomonas typographi]MBD1600493.1 OprD family porin [Pseudomonas typographi]